MAINWDYYFIKYLFRHFEMWTFNGETFDIEDLGGTLTGFYDYPESFFVENKL